MPRQVTLTLDGDSLPKVVNLQVARLAAAHPAFVYIAAALSVALVRLALQRCGHVSAALARRSAPRRSAPRRDPNEYPAAEIAELYHERWELELGYDEIKTELLEREETIRSRKPTE